MNDESSPKLSLDASQIVVRYPLRGALEKMTMKGIIITVLVVTAAVAQFGWYVVAMTLLAIFATMGALAFGGVLCIVGAGR